MRGAACVLLLATAACSEDAAVAVDASAAIEAGAPADLARPRDVALVPDGSNALPVDLASAADAAAPAEDAAAPSDGAVVPDGAAASDLGGLDGALTIHDRCFPMLGRAPDGGAPIGPSYDQFNPVIGASCEGTDHQAVQGIEKVVFLGDSITVGTPPTAAADFYRSRLAALLAQQYQLKAPDGVWQQVNLINGTGLSKTSGDFWDCAHWGGETDDLELSMQNQIAACFPTLPEPKKTLVVITVGGNDMNGIAKDGLNGVPQAQLLMQVDKSVANLRGAIRTLQDPMKFPRGVYVVFGNVYEFTDGTGDLVACPSAGLAGYNKPWPGGAPVFVYFNEQLMKVAVETKTDVLLMFELFCGHGFKRNDPNGPCYRGPNTPLWFDPTTCIHPNTEGHKTLAKLFFDVITQ